MVNDPKNPDKNNEQPKDKNSEEPFSLDWLEPALNEMPDAPPDAESGHQDIGDNFGEMNLGAIKVDPTGDLEDILKSAEDAARAQGLPDEAIDKLKQLIAYKLEGGIGLMNTAKNFAGSPSFAAMLQGAEQFTNVLGLLGHEYHRILVRKFGDGEYARIPICQCELTKEPTDHEHSSITPPNAPTDYDEKRKEFVVITKKFQRTVAALAALVYGIGIGGVQFGPEGEI